MKDLAGNIGARHAYHQSGKLDKARDWVSCRLQSIPGLTVTTQELDVPPRLLENATPTVSRAANISGERTGSDAKLKSEIVVIGAHYDTIAYTGDWEGLDLSQFQPALPGTPGANDNASGVAALLEVARLLQDRPLKRTVRFVAFANEEPPFFRNKKAMGSYQYADLCRKRSEKIHLMISLETLAQYTPDQYGAKPTHEKRGRLLSAAASFVGLTEETHYVAFLSHWRAGSGGRARHWAQQFAEKSSVEVRTVSLPALGPALTWSDDWSFTRCNYPAFTVTDTAYLRSDRYHSPEHDIPANLTRGDYESFAEVVAALADTIELIANQSPE